MKTKKIVCFMIVFVTLISSLALSAFASTLEGTGSEIETQKIGEYIPVAYDHSSLVFSTLKSAKGYFGYDYSYYPCYHYYAGITYNYYYVFTDDSRMYFRVSAVDVDPITGISDPAVPVALD